MTNPNHPDHATQRLFAVRIYNHGKALVCVDVETLPAHIKPTVMAVGRACERLYVRGVIPVGHIWIREIEAVRDLESLQP